MRYADGLLSSGEVVLRRARQHWLALLLDSRRSVLLWILGIVALVAYVVFGPVNQTLGTALGILAAALLVIGLLFFAIEYWEWWAQDYLITNRRILKVEGIINKRSADSSLEKINDAVLTQDIFGRMFGYGDLDILTAADAAIDRYRMLSDAPGFKRQMMESKHQLEMEVSYRTPPAPPFRASEPPAQAPPPPVASRPAESARSSAPPLSPARADSGEVTQTLSRLADLRDRGAITPEEYEAKKQELLGRL
jgi:Bacterial PH domain/Short C-terminal domain